MAVIPRIALSCSYQCALRSFRRLLGTKIIRIGTAGPSAEFEREDKTGTQKGIWSSSPSAVCEREDYVVSGSVNWRSRRPDGGVPVGGTGLHGRVQSSWNCYCPSAVCERDDIASRLHTCSSHCLSGLLGQPPLGLAGCPNALG